MSRAEFARENDHVMDYYQVLNVPRTATSAQIRSAYKKLAKEFHPDAKPGDKAASEKFKQATEAYEVLGDADKRKLYDQYGENYQHVQAGGGPGGQRPHGRTHAGPSGAGPIDMEDLFGGGPIDFGDLFGGRGGAAGRGRRAAPQTGGDFETSITIPFTMAASGGEYEVATGGPGDSSRLNVKIPAGIHEGAVIRLAGQGQPGVHGAGAGDLLITVRIAAHPHFRREGRDVLLDCPVTVTEAVLGAKIDVPTMTEGSVTVTIPPGTSSGAKLRLRSKGFPDLKTKTHGDQFVVLKIVVPKTLSDKAQKLFEELAEDLHEKPREGLWSS